MALSKRSSTRDHLLLRIMGAGALLLFLLLVIFLDAAESSSFDLWVSNAAQSLWSYPLAVVMGAVTILGSLAFLFPLSIAILASLLKAKDRPSAWFFSAVMLIGGSLVTIMKLLLHRLRPEPRLVHASGLSFPSGHATMTMVLALTLFFLLKDRPAFSGRKRTLLACLLAYVLLVGLSRIYLNVHWATDVIGGWLLGIFIVLAAVLTRRYLQVKRPTRNRKRN